MLDFIPHDLWPDLWLAWGWFALIVCGIAIALLALCVTISSTDRELSTLLLSIAALSFIAFTLWILIHADWDKAVVPTPQANEGITWEYGGMIDGVGRGVRKPITP